MVLKFYRFEDERTVYGIKVRERVFDLVKETPCGYWIKLFSCFDDKKWITKTARNRFAFPTRKEALENFRARKRRQIQILTAQLDNAKTSLMIAEEKLNAEMEIRSGTQELP